MLWSGDFDIENAYTQGYFSSKLGYVSSTKKRHRPHITLTILSIKKIFRKCLLIESREITTLFRSKESGTGGQILPAVGRWRHSGAVQHLLRRLSNVRLPVRVSWPATQHADAHSTAATIQQHKLKDNTLKKTIFFSKLSHVRRFLSGSDPSLTDVKTHCTCSILQMHYCVVCISSKKVAKWYYLKDIAEWVFFFQCKNQAVPLMWSYFIY